MGQELRDPSGNVIGYFMTPDEYKEMALKASIVDFERERAEEAAKGIVRKWDGTNGLTTAEAIKYLEDYARKANGGA